MKIETKALKTIEGMILAVESKSKMLRACYRFAHIALGECENPHPDWQRELEETYNGLKEGGII